MPAKIAGSAPRPSLGPPDLLVAIHTSRQSCSKAGRAQIFSARSGVDPGEYLTTSFWIISTRISPPG